MTCLIIFWYDVLCFFASFLKKSMLSFFNAIVTLTFSSFKISLSGGGRKSLITLSSPKGSSVYLIFVFIYFPPFSPISGSKYPDNIASICKSHGHYSFADTSNAIESIFLSAVINVFDNNSLWIKKGVLSYWKRYIVFGLILIILFSIPIKTYLLIN